MRSCPCPLSPRKFTCSRRAKANLNKRNPFRVGFLAFSLDINLPVSYISEYSKTNPYPMCDICFEPFQVTNSPISASLTANSSAKLPFGLRLSCPGQHPYCISCLTEYIKGKLDPSGTGDMSTHIIVFPILCPGCPSTHWETGIPDNVAEKVLDAECLSLWVHSTPE